MKARWYNIKNYSIFNVFCHSFGKILNKYYLHLLIDEKILNIKTKITTIMNMLGAMVSSSKASVGLLK